MPRRLTLSMCVFTLVAIVLAGCNSGPVLSEVKGSVKFDGALVEKGSIRFEPSDGKAQPVTGDIKDGQYAVKAPVGPTKVTISGYKSLGKVEHMPGSFHDKPGELLPEKYSNLEKSELKFDVKAGGNEKSWDLTK